MNVRLNDLPRGATDLSLQPAMEHVDAINWYIPRMGTDPSRRQSYAVVTFANAAARDAAMKRRLRLGGKVLRWTAWNAIECWNCHLQGHFQSDCTRGAGVATTAATNDSPKFTPPRQNAAGTTGTTRNVKKLVFGLDTVSEMPPWQGVRLRAPIQIEHKRCQMLPMGGFRPEDVVRGICPVGWVGQFKEAGLDAAAARRLAIKIVERAVTEGRDEIWKRRCDEQVRRERELGITGRAKLARPPRARPRQMRVRGGVARRTILQRARFGQCGCGQNIASAGLLADGEMCGCRASLAAEADGLLYNLFCAKVAPQPMLHGRRGVKVVINAD